MRCLRELEQSQWWPLEQIRELQSSRLQRLIEHAYQHVPYYRRTMDELGVAPAAIRSAHDLNMLPILTKADIRDAGESLLADCCDPRRLRRCATSGSTGEPLRFFSTREDRFTRGLARSLRAAQWAGVNPGDRHATLSRPRHYARRHEQLLYRMSRRVRRSKQVSYGHLTDDDLERIARYLQHERLHSLGGSPPLLALVAAYMRRRGLSAPHMNAIICGGEQLYPHARELLREVFGCEPCSKYSSFEVFDIASECSAHQGLHIQAEDVIVEVVDAAGNVLPEGEQGRVLLTNLHNYAMPLVRYEIGDIGAMDSSTCDCGRNLPRLVGMLGRASELIVTPSGGRIFAADLDLESLGRLGVRSYHIVQEDIDLVTVHLTWYSDIVAPDRAAGERLIAARLSRSMGDGIRVVIEQSDDIPMTAAGKHLVVESRLSPRQKGNREENEGGPARNQPDGATLE